jgi:hypothetical protein
MNKSFRADGKEEIVLKVLLLRSALVFFVFSFPLFLSLSSLLTSPLQVECGSTPGFATSGWQVRGISLFSRAD